MAGTAQGVALVLDEPLSFWGGLEPTTGEIIDRRHPQSGTILSGKVLLMSAGRGSSSGSSVLAEAIRLGTGPVAIVMLESDEIVTLGAVVADELYGVTVTVVVADQEVYEGLATGMLVTVAADGTISH